MVRIADMDDRRLILLQPLVHLAPVQGKVPGDGWSILDRVRIAPDGVLGNAITHPHGPVARLALERTARRVVRALEQVHAHLGLREVEDGQVPLFV